MCDSNLLMLENIFIKQLEFLLLTADNRSISSHTFTFASKRFADPYSFATCCFFL